MEIRETTLPSRETVWSYFLVESLYLSTRNGVRLLKSGAFTQALGKPTIHRHLSTRSCGNSIAHFLLACFVCQPLFPRTDLNQTERTFERTSNNTPLPLLLWTSSTVQTKSSAHFSFGRGKKTQFSSLLRNISPAIRDGNRQSLDKVPATRSHPRPQGKIARLRAVDLRQDQGGVGLADE